MKRLLSVNTGSAGTVLVIPDYMDIEGIVGLKYLDETTLPQRDAAAHYLLEEGFIEFAKGRIELKRL